MNINLILWLHYVMVYGIYKWIVSICVNMCTYMNVFMLKTYVSVAWKKNQWKIFQWEILRWGNWSLRGILRINRPYITVYISNETNYRDGFSVFSDFFLGIVIINYFHNSLIFSASIFEIYWIRIGSWRSRHISHYNVFRHSRRNS